MCLRWIFIRSLILFALVSMLFVTLRTSAQAPPSVFSGKFYKFDVIAVDGQPGLTTALPGPSINDNGVVSFVGRNLGSNLFISDALGAYREVNPGGTATSTIIDGNTQINNSNQITAQEAVNTLSQNILRIWNGNAQNTSIIAAGANGGGGFNDFAAIFKNPSLNNSGQLVFSAQARNPLRNVLATGLRTDPSFSQTDIALQPLFPMLADDGRLVVRAGGLTTSPIRLYSYNLASFTDIATTTMGFTRLGQRPGISDDGQVVVFYGDLGSNMLNLTQGVGIFASIDIGGGTRRILRITNRQVERLFTGGNDDGVCDSLPLPGEMCQQGELGFSSTNNPLFFTSFDPDSRVAVANQSLDQAGIEGDTFVVSFIGTPNAGSSGPQYFSNQRGLWTIRVDVRMESGILREKPARAIPVIQINDGIGTRTVTDIVVYDQIANATTNDSFMVRTQRRGDHKVAFYASTNSGNIIVRGSHLDSDEDGLLDHWETMGIDFNLDGNVDLPLHQAPFGANPNRKDLFVEIDYMDAPGNHTHRPVAAALQMVSNVFAFAPVTNPIGPNGITLHSMVDESLPDISGLRFIGRNAGPANDFTDLKYGEPYNPCGTNANDGHFGTAADRMAGTNCTNILGARRLALRYAIFGHSHTTAVSTSSGIAELGGNDFMVTLGNWVQAAIAAVSGVNCMSGETPAQCGQREAEAGTYMHEMGHTLNLKHGGDQQFNCKPNYLSLMSYSLQFKLFDPSRPLNYSSQALANLDETALSEASGIGAPAGRMTTYGLMNGTMFRIVPSNGPIDWNGVNGSGEVGVMANINFIQVAGCNNDDDANSLPDGLTLLTGVNDWSRIQLGFLNSQNFNNGGDSFALPGEEITGDQVLSIAMSVDPDGDGIPTVNDNCPGTFNPDQADSDGDGFGNVCDCDGSISPTSALFPARDAAGEVNLTTLAGCTWIVSTNDDWIVITSAQSGVGSDPVTFELRENFGAARSGTISIGGLAFTVVQAGSAEGCSYSISPTSVVFASTGGMATISVTASPGCAWQAVSNVGWITIASGSPAIGSGSVNYVVAANTGNTRAGKITIAGNTLAIKQSHP